MSRVSDSIRAQDPIFEAMSDWMSQHDDVSVSMFYNQEEKTVDFRMVWPESKSVLTRHISFETYSKSRLSMEDQTASILDEMYSREGE